MSCYCCRLKYCYCCFIYIFNCWLLQPPWYVMIENGRIGNGDGGGARLWDTPSSLEHYTMVFSFSSGDLPLKFPHDRGVPKFSRGASKNPWVVPSLWRRQKKIHRFRCIFGTIGPSVYFLILFMASFETSQSTLNIHLWQLGCRE